MWSEADLEHISKVELFEAYAKKRIIESLRAAKFRCQSTGIEFDLSVEDLMPLPLDCPVLGIKLDWFVDGRGGSDFSPSIDRLDPGQGYVPGNVEIISNRANRIKNDAQLDEVKKIVLWMEQRKRTKKGAQKLPAQTEFELCGITSPAAQ